MNQYRKLIAAIVGVGVLLAQRYGLDLSGQEGALVDVLVSIATAVGVWAVPNVQKGAA